MVSYIISHTELGTRKTQLEEKLKKKMPTGIKRRITFNKPRREYEHILPAAISTVSSCLPEDVELIQLYVELRQEGEKLSYNYERE